MRVRPLPTIGALGLLIALLAVPFGEGATNAVRRALFAANAGAVNGIEASKTPKPGQLVPLGRNGKLPAAVIPANLRGSAGPAGPVGPSGPQGAQGAQGPQGPAGRSALTPLQSGERIFGVFAVQGQGPNLWTGVSFQVPAAPPVDSRHIVIAGNDTITGDGCTGSTTAPVSSPGYVCIYPALSAGTSTGFGWGARCSCGDPAATGDGSPYGFIVQLNGAGPGLITASGVWVYTAP